MHETSRDTIQFTVREICLFFAAAQSSADILSCLNRKVRFVPRGGEIK